MLQATTTNGVDHMYTKLIVPLDRSPLSEQALEAAVTIARASGAELQVVMAEPRAVLPALHTNSSAVEEVLAAEYLALIHAAIEHQGFDRVSHALLHGEPDRAVAAHARATGASLIVLASHGRTGLRRAWSGSVADSIVRHAETPVLMLREAIRRGTHLLPPVDIRRILVTLDGSTAARAMLAAACDLACAMGAELQLLRIVSPVYATSATFGTSLAIPEAGIALPVTGTEIDSAATERRITLATHELHDIADALADDGIVDVTTHVETASDPVTGILDFVRVHGIDVVAMATHGRGASRLVFGSTADGVIRGSTVPMLLARPSKAMMELPTLSAESVWSQLPACCHHN